jgi:hypothetical protein
MTCYCANPKCRRALTDSDRTLHCDECHRTDPELIKAALEYWRRVSERQRGAA